MTTDLRATLTWIRQAIAARGPHDPSLLNDIDERAFYALAEVEAFDDAPLAAVVPLRRGETHFVKPPVD